MNGSTPDERARAALQVAADLVDAVQRGDMEGVQQALHRADFYALTVTLAGMLDQDLSTGDVVGLTCELLGGRRPLEPCGTRAAFERHRFRGETPCDPCTQAARVYYRFRKRDQREAARAS